MRRNRPKKSIIPYIFILIIVLIAFDASLRWFFYQPDVKQVAGHTLLEPNSFWKIKSNYFADISVGEENKSTAYTNRYGMRVAKENPARNISLKKPENTTRIAIMGDSIPFGWGLSHEDMFPTQLQHTLGAEYEILNFAAPQFTAYRATLQYENLVNRFHPDLLILGYGFFDSHYAHRTEKEEHQLLTKLGLIPRDSFLAGFLEKISFAFATYRKNQYRQAFQQYAEKNKQVSQTNQFTPKVPAGEFVAYLTAIIEKHQKQGGKTVLLNTNLLNFRLAEAFQTLQDTFSIPMLDIRAYFELIGEYTSRIERYKRQLERPGLSETSGQSSYVFRVYVPQAVKTNHGIFIVGNHPKLGDNTPGRVPLYDDGTHGDEVARDGIWSLEIDMEVEKPVYYTYTNAPEPRWATKDTYPPQKNTQYFLRIHPHGTPTTVRTVFPVFTYDTIPFSGLVIENTPYPNALGHASIANRLETLIRELE